MINHKTPGGLFAKLQDDISHEIEETPSGLVKVIFSSNNSSSADTNLQNISH
jgi:hypothetical protein